MPSTNIAKSQVCLYVTSLHGVTSCWFYSQGKLLPENVLYTLLIIDHDEESGPDKQIRGSLICGLEERIKGVKGLLLAWEYLNDEVGLRDKGQGRVAFQFQA